MMSTHGPVCKAVSHRNLQMVRSRTKRRPHVSEGPKQRPGIKSGSASNEPSTFLALNSDTKITCCSQSQQTQTQENNCCLGSLDCISPEA
eukprot:3621707-Amphidinium_carterae.1